MSQPPLPGREDLAGALRFDRPRLQRLKSKVERARTRGRPHDRNLQRLADDLARSVALREARAASVPACSYPDELPVSGRREEIAAAVRDHPVVVVCGETGSGKSTQLPKILLELGLGVEGAIAHTQPRRLAASTLSRRLSAELGTRPGEQVGFKVRFTDDTSDTTLVKLMTDGLLLAETRGDRDLLRYDAVILDEAHERSLNIDFLLGYLKRLLTRRDDLKVVITSATLDAERFSEFFTAHGRPAPVIEVSGRTWPVEVRYRPPTVEDDEVDWPREVADAVDEAARLGDGDMLVFLPTQRHIQETAKVLEGRPVPGGRPAEVLPLYARLPDDVQKRVFEPGGRRRIVLATNVAESSVTVPGIRYVIDTGLVRTSRYSPRTRIQRLPIEPISRASAEQRKGRCGRVGPGVCLRLYDQDDEEAREAYTQPEIQRSNLAAVVLQMAALNLGRVEDFPFLDPPRRSMIEDGRRTLTELGALDEDGRLTPLGRTLSRLPVDPRIGRMILAAHDEGCLADMLVVAAALETRDPRERLPGKEKEADALTARLGDGDSDVTTLLALWDLHLSLREGRSRSQWGRALREHFLSPSRCREWADVHRQLTELVKDAGMAPGPRTGDREALHRALVAGFLSQVAHKTSKFGYTGADGKELFLWPGSTLFERKPAWVVAVEIVETKRRYARTVARVDPKVVETLAAHLVKRRYRDPFWDRTTGHVQATETVTLFGLPLIPRRRSRYDHVDPLLCRELFIRNGLVEGAFDTGAPFLRHNLDLANGVAALEARTRRRDLLADLDVRFDFYDRRLPPEVVGAPSFHRWRRRAEQVDPGILFMSRDDLLRTEVDDGIPDAYPDELLVAGTTLPLRYRLDPGEEHDGVTLSVPLPLLDTLQPEHVDWLVPGMLRDKLIELTRTLPKPVRRALVPVPEHVDAALAELEVGQGPFLPAVARALQRAAGVPVTADGFDPDRLVDHLRMRIEVLGEKGEVLAAGRDLTALRQELGRVADEALQDEDDGPWSRDGLVRWDFGRLPESVTVRRAGVPVVLFPALVDQGNAVGLRVFPRADLARSSTAAGIRRLLALALGGSLGHRLRRSPGWEGLLLRHAAGDDSVPLADQVVERVIERAMAAVAAASPDLSVDEICGPETYAGLLDGVKHGLVPALDEVLPVVTGVLAATHDLRTELAAVAERPWGAVLEEASAWLARTTGEGHLATTPWERLGHTPRYLLALQRRLERVRQRGTTQDAALAARLHPWDEALARLGPVVADLPPAREALVTLGTMVEEYRVSVFAQELGTAIKVSPTRLSRARDALEAALAHEGITVTTTV